MKPTGPVLFGWVVAIAAAVAVRAISALSGPLMWGYDAWGHVSYALFLDLYAAVPWADQGWSYFHPPLHYSFGWLLALFGDGDTLMRGLPLLNGAFSVATAFLAAALVRRTQPDRPGLQLTAFAAVAFLPVHLFMSAMPGNELTETFLAGVALTLFIANESRRRPTLGGAAATGGVIGLALLTKFSGLLPLAVALASLVLRIASDRERGAIARCGARGAVMIAVALLVSAPYYLRNVQTFGNPFQLSRDFALVQSVEKDQPPGERQLADYLRLPARMFSEPNPLAPHMLGSVWGTVYLNVWADTYRESDVARALEADRGRLRSIRWMGVLGLALTALAAFGAILVARDVWKGRNRAVGVPVLVACAGTLGAFVLFSWLVPIWSALKSSYLLGLSLPYGFFLARSAEYLSDRTGRGLGGIVPVTLLGVSACAASLEVPGWVLPRRADAPATGAVRFYFGEYDEARRIYGRLIAGSGYKAGWIDNLAAVELADGNPERARSLYARSIALAGQRGLADPYRDGRLAVATALAGGTAQAEELLDAVLATDAKPELFANRGVLRLVRGDLDGAESDLRNGLSGAPEMLPARIHLASVLTRQGRLAEAEEVRSEAVQQACRGPRGYPYGLGTGEVLQWGVGQRWLLRADSGVLEVASPDFLRGACGRLGEEIDERG